MAKKKLREEHYLIVDDDPMFAEMLRSIIMGDPNTSVMVDIYHSGEEVVYTPLDKYDFAIVDLLMDGIDGIQTAEEIRKQTNIPIVILTASSEDERCDQLPPNLSPIFILSKSEHIIGTYNGIKTIKFNADNLLNMAESRQKSQSINICIGMMMNEFDIGESEANGLLKKLSQKSRTSMDKLARKLITKELPLSQFDGL